MTGRCDLARQIGASLADTVKIRQRIEVLFLHPDAIDPDPDQPRQEFDDDGLARLAESLRRYGQLQPVLVRKEGKTYVLVAGERRWRAAKLAGVPNIQALLCRGGDSRSIQLIENLLREDLKPVEQARAYEAIMKKEGWSARELARQLSIEHSGITRALKLLKLPEKVQEAVDQGKIAPTTAYEISRRPRKEQTKLAREAAAGRIRGADLRRQEPTRRPLTLGGPPAWTSRHNGTEVTVTGDRSHDEVVSALEAALTAARAVKQPLAGGLGRR